MEVVRVMSPANVVIQLLQTTYHKLIVRKIFIDTLAIKDSVTAVGSYRYSFTAFLLLCGQSVLPWGKKSPAAITFCLQQTDDRPEDNTFFWR